MQVYTVFYVHNASGAKFLVFRKRAKGYFFDKKLVPGGQNINGGGKFAFAGGKREQADNAKDNAIATAGIRELYEETGVDLRGEEGSFFVNKHPKHSFVMANLEDGEIKIDGTTGQQALTLLMTKINMNLAQGTLAAEGVKDNSLGTWDAVTMAHPNCPESNELESAEIWNTVDQLELLKAWHKDNATNWFGAFVAMQFDVKLA